MAHVHAKTGLTEPVRHRARQQPGSGEGPGQGKGAVPEPRGCSAMTGRRAVLPPSPSPHLAWYSRELHEFQTQRLDAHQRTVKGRLVEIGGDERRMAAAGFDAEFLERPATDTAQNTSDGDPVAVSVRAGSPPVLLAGPD